MPSGMGSGAFPGGFNLDPRYLPDAPPDRGTVIHKFGRITLQQWRYRKVPHYEVLLDGKIIATERHPETALQTARRKLNRPKHGAAIARTSRQCVELFAYRGWELKGDILMPIAFGARDNFDTWAGPVAHSDFKPNEREGSGLWAVKMHPQYIRELLTGYNPPVHGIVQLAGQVVEHERGYRAERTTIRLLRVEFPLSEGFKKCLEDRYQCQVFPANPKGGR